MRLRLGVLTLGGLLVVAGTAKAAVLTIAPKNVHLVAGQAQQYNANQTCTWNASVGNIQSDGLYRAPVAIAAATVATISCSTAGGATTSVMAYIDASSAIAITVNPTTANVTAGSTLQLNASVTSITKGPANPAVTWAIAPALGSISTSGLYTAPATVTAPQQVTVTATSVADPNKKGTAVLTLSPPISISVTPANASVAAGGSVQLSVAVSGPANTAVNWSLSPALGSISSAGLYVAPSNLTAQQNVTVKATSVVDPTKSASAVVIVSPVVAVAVTPLTQSISAGTALQLAATVTGTTNTAVNWTLNPSVGSISSAGLYTAPASVTAQQSVAVIATSVADPTRQASAALTVVPVIAVTVAPAAATVALGQTAQFTAAVSGAANTAVTWTVNGANGGSSATGTISPSGLYTAPAVLPSGTITVAAISAADQTKSASATVTLSSAPATLLQAFTLTERFGVSHPQQVIDFDYSGTVDPRNSYMIGPSGTEVPYQVLSNGHIAVQTDLPANATKTWSLYAGRAPQAFSGLVAMSSVNGYYQVTNGLTGVRVLQAGTGTDTTLAPIQGIQMRDSTWTAAGPNHLYTPIVPTGGPALQPLTGKTATTTVLEQGPLEVIVQVSYTYDRPALYYGNTLLVPAGPGFYNSTITLQAGQPSVLIEDDTDMDLREYLDLTSALTINEARYRGTKATSIANGRMPTGGIYAPDDTSPVDGYRNFQYSIPGYSAYVSGDYTSYQLIKRMAIWDPWAADTGWYWMMYDNTAPPSAPVVGLFAGRASRALGVCNSGPGVYTVPAGASGGLAAGFVESAGPAAGIALGTTRQCPTGNYFTRSRISWGIFVGTKGGDLADPSQVQNINLQMNLLGGMNLNKIYRYGTNFADPPGGFSSLFITAQQQASVISRVQTDPAYYNYLYNAEPTARPLLDAWRDTTGAQAHQLVLNIMQVAQQMVDTYVNHEGIYFIYYRYWHGGELMSNEAALIAALLAGNQISPADRVQLKTAAALFASILWDDDLAPLQAQTGLNLGTYNMPIQQENYRAQYAIMLPFLPGMQANADFSRQNAHAMLDGEVNSYGAPQDAPHYAEAAMGPLLNTFQQLKVNSSTDPFQTEPKIGWFAEFYMNILTPPEPRFGGSRKLPSFGNSATESEPAYMFGQMATGFANVNADLSARLVQAWTEADKREIGFIGTSVLKIDDQLPAKPLTLHNAYYPGYCSIQRNDPGTPNETAVWVINGDFYSDHRHDDNGSIAVYALDAPLSIDWGSMYSPSPGSSFMHSLVLPESVLPQRWDAPNPGVAPTFASPWDSVGGSFTAFDNSTQSIATLATSNNTVWNRVVTSIHANPAYPVILIQDAFTGPDAAARKVFSLNLMAQGAVTTPVGAVVPPAAFYSSSGSPQQLPSATPAQTLASGLNQFHFTGQWKIDWDLFTLAAENQQFSLGNWGHNWSTSFEAAQFQSANGQPFQEVQDIFRLDGAGSFTVALLPAFKGQQRTNQSVTAAGGTLPLRIADPASGEQTVIDATGFSFQNSQETLVTSLSAAAESQLGITVSGGPTEIVIKGGHVTITASGTPGVRSITLPGVWTAVAPLSFSNGVYTLNYAGGAPLQVVL